MSNPTSRRNFLKAAAVSATAVSMSAKSYARVIGANDRISLAQIGCGSRGCGAHMAGVHPFDKEENVQFIAVCDPWRVAREKAAGLVKDWYGLEARQCVSYRDILEMDDVDAVMIASCDHQHTTHLKAAAEAKKDVYCEKPLGKDLKGLLKACDAVRENEVVFQAGTQLRSYPSFTGCRDLYRTGILGKTARVEQHRNSNRPYWYGYLKDAKKEDVDWNEFLMGAPKQAFNSDRFTGWYGYRDFSDGPVPGLGSHYIDLVHYITGAKYPTSCVCLGGINTWKDDGYNFDAPDHVEALWTYPEDFMVTYSTNFGNAMGNSFKLIGNKGMIDMNNWNSPTIQMNGEDAKPVEVVKRVNHMQDWLQCIRSRETCNADVEAAQQHAVAVIMGMESYDSGRRVVYDQKRRKIKAG